MWDYIQEGIFSISKEKHLLWKLGCILTLGRTSISTKLKTHFKLMQILLRRKNLIKRVATCDLRPSASNQYCTSMTRINLAPCVGIFLILLCKLLIRLPIFQLSLSKNEVRPEKLYMQWSFIQLPASSFCFFISIKDELGSCWIVIWIPLPVLEMWRDG